MGITASNVENRRGAKRSLKVTVQIDYRQPGQR
jgi:hypothetical protein